jgi:hypothetical protein
MLASVYELWARVIKSRPCRRVLKLANMKNGEGIPEVAAGTGGADHVSLPTSDHGNSPGLTG